MKPFSFLLILAACNNTAQVATNNKEVETSENVKTAKLSTDDSKGCTSFYWFKKGTVAVFDEYDKDGKKFTSTTTTITDVRPEGAATLAEFTSNSGESSKEFKGKYKCEGDKVMMDIGSMFKDNNMNRGGMTMEMNKTGWLTFPLNMKTGDDLEETPFEMKGMKNGKAVMTMTSTVNSRKVGPKEKVTTPAGSWDAFKITEVRTMEISMEGMDKKMAGPATSYNYWFVPNFGVVKTELKEASGKLMHRSELASIK
jgi:hypothetical protein